MNKKKEEQIIEDLSKTVKSHAKNVAEMVRFFKDWGAYKRRQLYKLSDFEYKKTMKEFESYIMFLQLSSIVSDFVFNENKKAYKMYGNIIKKVMDKIDQGIRKGKEEENVKTKGQVIKEKAISNN